MIFDIILEEEEEGGYSVHCPLLKGCHSQGNTRDEAIANIREAIELYLEVAHEKASSAVHSQSKCSVIEIAV
ncbi:MAG: type II toxin-antitoxin system HicB family antitoxin [Methanomicrobiales archaeon HGW-Methanomicrobiales-4]|nr:MAG: type II toxin-antitoxin system HicB family antitoxin [Methanomicrobiales archaeon HGW-Methanomicrobiales-4]